MQTVRFWRLVALLLIATTIVIPTAVIGLDTSEVAVANDDDSGDGEGDDDGNRGHGNDEDGEDADNPGRGNGGSNGNQGQGDGDNKDKPVVMAEDYRVEVTCDYDGERDRTTCVFTGIAPPEAQDISHIDLPVESVCAEVVGGEYEYVDPDPNTHVTGYKSLGSEGAFTLILDGEVTTFGTATYWIKTGGGVFPATGQGLFCGEFAADAQVETTGKTVAASTPVAETGTVIVETYACTDVPEDRTSFDWFGMCEPGAESLTFELAPAGATAGEGRTAETGSSGEATFDSLSEGAYQLDAVDASWCHAKSDNVTAEGDVIVEPGATTTVWIFMCADTASGV